MRTWPLGLLLLLGACLGLAQTAPVLLRPGDLVEVLVYGHDAYSGEYTVFEDGTLQGRGFGRLKVEGRTVEQVRADVSKALAKTIREPNVSLFLRNRRATQAYVIGAEPGVVPITPGMDLRQLVARISMPADPDLFEATLFRKGEAPRKIDLPAVLRGDPSAWSGAILPDDLFSVLPRSYIRVWFIGPFGKTGQIRLAEGIDIHQALAEIGGVNTGVLTQDEAHLIIRRGPETLRERVRKNPDRAGLRLESGDTVMLDQPKTIRLAISGEVESPGEYVVREDLGLAGLVLQAKGAKPEGTLKNVIVFRGNEILQVDATGPLSGRPPSHFKLEDRDFVFVQRNEAFVYVFGEINRPGRIAIPDGRELHAADAFSLAGGLAPRGTLRRVHLMRADKEGKMKAQVFHLDRYVKDGEAASNPLLHPGDILYFGEPKGFTIGQFGQVLGAAFMIENLFRR